MCKPLPFSGRWRISLHLTQRSLRGEGGDSIKNPRGVFPCLSKVDFPQTSTLPGSPDESDPVKAHGLCSASFYLRMFPKR